MFVNCSNHSSGMWGKDQIQAARAWGEIKDHPFPYVDSGDDEKSIRQKAQDTVDEILSLRPDAVLCQGEYVLSYAIVRRLRERGIVAVAACSERIAEEQQMPDGSTRKISRFSFVRFREYP